MTRIKFYSYKIFEGTENISDMFKSVDIVVRTVQLVAEVFNGKVRYDGDGSETVQYDDVVEFENLSEDHKKAILTSFPFAREVTMFGGR